jgi:hypothetical protein
VFAFQCMNANKTNPSAHGDSVSTPKSVTDDLAGLVKKKAVARAASLSPRTIDNLQRRKLIPYIRLSARCVRYHLPSVLAALRKFEVKEAGR